MCVPVHESVYNMLWASCIAKSSEEAPYSRAIGLSLRTTLSKFNTMVSSFKLTNFSSVLLQLVIMRVALHLQHDHNCQKHKLLWFTKMQLHVHCTCINLYNKNVCPKYMYVHICTCIYMYIHRRRKMIFSMGTKKLARASTCAISRKSYFVPCTVWERD